MRFFLLALGLVLVAWGGAGVFLFTVHPGDLKAEDTFCRYSVCDPEGIQEAMKKSPTIEGYRALVKRNPQFPFGWADLGEAYAKAGNRDLAEKCFGRVVETAPRWPISLIRAAEFYFDDGQWKRALPITTDILDQVSDYDGRIYAQYLKHVPLSEVLANGFPKGNPRPARTWLAYLEHYGSWADVQQTWKWATNRGLINVATANGLISGILNKRPAEAAQIWKDYLGPWSDEEYMETNYILNGGFEKGFTGSMMDWTFQPTEGVELQVQDGLAAEGKMCMRLKFDGEHNIGWTGFTQFVVLRPGTYRLKAQIRTEGITTDQGVQLKLSDVCETDKFLGTRAWTRVDVPCTVKTLKAYRLDLIRTPSTRFDNKLGGTIWLDDIRIERT